MTFGRENPDAQSNLGVGASNKVAEIRLAARPTGEQPNSSAPRISDRLDAEILRLTEFVRDSEEWLRAYNLLRARGFGAFLQLAQAFREFKLMGLSTDKLIDCFLIEAAAYEAAQKKLDQRGIL